MLHLLAIAQEAGCPIDLALFNEISARTPNLCHLAPAGPTHMPDLYEAGGIPAVQAELAKKGLLDLAVPTVTGKTLGENIEGAKILNDKAIRSIDNPYSQTGGLQILWGNIAPDGCVVKRSAVAPRCRSTSAPPVSLTARTPRSRPSTQGTSTPVMWSSSGTRPQGRPRYAGDAQPHQRAGRHEAGYDRGAHHRRPLLRRVPRRSHRPCQPEAASGGPIGLVKEGDTIEIDIPNASIHLAVSEEELAARKAVYIQPEPNIKTGWLARYARLVTSANLGAVLK